MVRAFIALLASAAIAAAVPTLSGSPSWAPWPSPVPPVPGGMPPAGYDSTRHVYTSSNMTWLDNKVTAQWEVRRPKTVTNGSVASDIIDVVLTFPSTGYGGFGFAGSRMSGLFVICFLPQGGVREGWAPSCTLFDGVGFVATEVKGHLRLLNYTYLDNGFNQIAYRTSAQFVKAVPGTSRCIFAHGDVKWQVYEPVYHGPTNRGYQDILVYGGTVTPQPASSGPTPPPPYPTAPPLPPAPAGGYKAVANSSAHTFLAGRVTALWSVLRPVAGGDDVVDVTLRVPKAGGWAGFGTAPQFMEGPQLVCAFPAADAAAARCQMYAGHTQTNQPNLTAEVTTLRAAVGADGSAAVTARVLAKDLGFFPGVRRVLFALGQFNFARNLAHYHGFSNCGATQLNPYAPGNATTKVF